MTRLQNLAANDWNRAAFPSKEEITRLIRGDRTHVETVLAVVQLDTGAAGSQISGGGVQEQQDRNQIERAGLVEVDASQEIFPNDQFVIYGELWSVMGKPVGSDSASKTISIIRLDRQRGRQPNVNTRA